MVQADNYDNCAKECIHKERLCINAILKDEKVQEVSKEQFERIIVPCLDASRQCTRKCCAENKTLVH
jgi:hypothetical protein